MKAGCLTCCYFFDGNDGEYGSGPYWCECAHPMRKNINDKYCVSDHLFFPYFPAPGCYIPSEFLAPKKYEPEWLPIADNFYDWLSRVSNNLSKWSGDIIEIVD